nr:reverse transcriptase domain-containing protein [Tanacetum cinerariifolium]
MRTRNSYFPNNSSATILRHRNKRRIPNIVEPELRTIVEMADNRTMEELLQAPTEGYGEAIVILEINADHFEIKTNLLQLVQGNPYHGFKRENPHTHINNFKRITSTLKFRDVPNNVIKVMMFPYSLVGNARVCKSDDRIDKLADQISTLVDIFAKTIVTPTPVKAVEESCVTCGGNHAYYNCPNTDSNQPSVCVATGTYNQVAPQNRASNYMAPPSFALNQSSTSGTLPSNTIPNPKGEMKAITTRSGVAYEGPSIPTPKKVVEQETKETTNKEQSNFQGRMDVCHALADLGASINLMPLSIWKKLSLPELTPTRMTLELANRSITRPKGVVEDVFIKVGKFHFPTDFVVVDFEADPRVPLILEEITLRVNDEAVTFNLNRTTRHSSTYDDLSVNRIDIIDVAREEYAQEVLGFSSNSLGGSPTLTFDPILSDSSPSLTPFEGSDLILEEIEAYLKDDSISLEIDHANFDPEGDICLIEKLLNDDPLQLSPMDLKKVIKAKSSIEEPQEVELKDSPSHLEYAYLEENELIPTCLVTGWRVCIDYRKLIPNTYDSPSWEGNTVYVFKNCIDAFESLKKKLTEVSILVVPDWNLPFELMCDASDFTIGVVLGQRKTKHFQPIHYASKTMTEAQMHYTMTEKEMLVVVYAFEKFRPYLVLSKSIMYTDHSAFKYLLNKQDAKPRLIRWVLLLQEFDIIICDKKGSENLAADHLSRLENPHKDVSENKDINEKFPLETLGVISSKSTPMTSGQVEVSNRGLKRILERMVGENHASWLDKLDDALWAFHTAFKTPISCTPYKLTAGDHQKLQLDELNELRDQAYENSLIYKERTKKLHDSKIKNCIFNVGITLQLSS